jgi:cell division protein FtsB
VAEIGEGRARSDDDERVEELLRVNAELAAEIRRLNLGPSGPRTSSVPAARRVGRIVEERDSLAARLEAAQAELAAVTEERDWLRGHVEELRKEVTRLRSGARGLLRRAKARLLGA